MTDTAAPDRLALFLRSLRDGLSQRQAALVSRCARTTVLRAAKRDPAFAAILHEAEQLSADIRKQWRDEAISEQYFVCALEQSERYRRKDAPSKRDDTRRQRRLLAKLHGVNTALYPGCSPSHTSESDDPLERIRQRQVRAKMADAFEERRRQKRGSLAGTGGNADNAAAPSAPPPGSRHMTSRQVQLFLGYVASGQTADGAARRLGLSRDDILDHRDATPGFALLLGEALGQGSEAQERYRQRRRAPAGNTPDSQRDAAPSEPPKKGVARALF